VLNIPQVIAYAPPLPVNTSVPAPELPSSLPAYSCVDGALSASRLQHLRHVFRADSPYWKEHDYDAIGSNSSRRVGYFSYIYPFREQSSPRCSVEVIIDEIFKVAVKSFPELASKAAVGTQSSIMDCLHLLKGLLLVIYSGMVGAQSTTQFWPSAPL
jgi:hypothetical protein